MRQFASSQQQEAALSRSEFGTHRIAQDATLLARRSLATRGQV